MALVPYKYCNPYSENTEYKNFIIQGEFIKIHQDIKNGIGKTFWDCSYVLSDFIEKKYKRDWQSTTCIELGTGCGLIPITLSLLKCRAVYATDLEKVLEHTERNIKDNYRECMSSIKLKELEWGKEEDLDFFKEIKIDLIIISDCLYKEAPWEKLLETLLYFSQLNSDLEIIFAYKIRYIYQTLFLDEIVKYYEIEKVSEEFINEEFQNSGFVILKMRSKRII